MCRGIGDPLVGAYTRTYIVHMGQKRRESQVDYIMTAIEDLVISCRWVCDRHDFLDLVLVELRSIIVIF